MKKQIRKILIETKEKKDRILIEREIIKSRIVMIFESEENIKKFNSLSENKKIKYSFQVLQEMAYQQENGVLNEQLLSIMKALFGTTIGGGFGQAILEPALNFILSGVGMKDNMLKKFVISFLSKKEGFWNMFKDCETLTKAVAESMIEAIAMKGQQFLGVGSFMADAIRNMIGDVAAKTAMVENLEKQLGDTICQYFGKATNNASKVLDKVKDEQDEKTSGLSGLLGGIIPGF
jgi:hypothetical protein